MCRKKFRFFEPYPTPFSGGFPSVQVLRVLSGTETFSLVTRTRCQPNIFRGGEDAKGCTLLWSPAQGDWVLVVGECCFDLRARKKKRKRSIASKLHTRALLGMMFSYRQDVIAVGERFYELVALLCVALLLGRTSTSRMNKLKVFPSSTLKV